MKAIAVLVGMVALLAATAAAHGHHHHGHDGHLQDFAQCFCWDSTTNNFCLGDDWYNSDPCQRFFMHAYGWPAVAVGTGFLALLVFPALFYCARWCCRCCGGAHSTPGCCCSDVSGRASFPGYRNRSIIFSKAFFFGCGIATIVMTACALNANSNLHWDVLNVVQAVSNGVNTVSSTLAEAQDAAVLLSAGIEAPALAPASLADGATSMAQVFASPSNDVQDTLNHVSKHESRSWVGRNAITQIVLWSGALVTVAGFLCCIFNVHRVTGIVMVTLCVHLATLALVYLPHHYLKETSEYACQLFDETTVPLAVGALKRYGACENPQVSAAIASTYNATANYTTNPRSDFCRDYKTACDAAGSNCTMTFCADAATYKNSTIFAANFTQSNMPLFALYEMIAPFASMRNGSQYSLAVRDAATRLVRFRDNALGPLQAILGDLAFVNDDCTYARSVLFNDVRNNLCGGFTVQTDSQATAGDIHALLWVGVAMIVALILGMKRFRPLNSYDPLRGHRASAESEPLAPGGAPPRVVIAVVPGESGALNGDAISGVVVKEDPPLPPQRQSYGTTAEDAPTHTLV